VKCVLTDTVPRLHGVAAFGNSFFHNRKTNLWKRSEQSNGKAAIVCNRCCRKPLLTKLIFSHTINLLPKSCDKIFILKKMSQKLW